MAPSVQRYFFAIRERDRAEDDPDSLPDVAAGRVRNSGGCEKGAAATNSDDGRTGSSPTDAHPVEKLASQLGLFHHVGRLRACFADRCC